MGEEFVNWSGSLRFTPGERAQPASEDEVAALVRRAAEAGGRVRPVGSGHSSMPLVATDDLLVSLDRLAGVVDHDATARRARVLPGTGLEDAGESLAAVGLAMPNLGDVDYQAIAGAIGTGTHGTGRRLGNLSTMLVGGRLVTGTGEVVPFGVDAGQAPDDDLVRAVQVSLGSLGILTSLTLQLVPAFDLRRVVWCTHIDWALEHFDELAERNRHADLYWYPRSDHAQVRVSNPPDRRAEPEPPDADLHADQQGPSHRVLPQHREIHFDEMEYLLPADAWRACFDDVRQRVKERHRQTVAWRVLVRTVAADEAMLSPCTGRPTVSIALLQNAELPHEPYFRDLEPVLQAFGGRPHWGKKHTMRAEGLGPLYPEWDAFGQVRRRLDPHGTLLNDHLVELLGDER